MHSQKMADHLRVDQYGDFQLTKAVRPWFDLRVVPREGYRIGMHHDMAAGLRVPVLAAAVSRERLFETFLSLLEPAGPDVNVILETSHQSSGVDHRDLRREHMDLPVLASNLCDFEDLLLNDGCTGVAVMSANEPIEVQFDEHKLLVVYARRLRPFEQILQEAGVKRDDQLKLITEADHLHTSTPAYAEEFQQLCYRIGVGEPAQHVSW